jgi:hypothetical protein
MKQAGIALKKSVPVFKPKGPALSFGRELRYKWISFGCDSTSVDEPQGVSKDFRVKSCVLNFRKQGMMRRAVGW